MRQNNIVATLIGNIFNTTNYGREKEVNYLRDISTETKKAVNELAEKLNYQPNTVALNLRQKKTNTIGVIIPEIVHFFFSTVISGIEDVA